MSTPADAQSSAAAIVAAFQRYDADFRRITRRAQQRFEQRDWHTGHADAVERIELYDEAIGQIRAELQHALGSRYREHTLWIEIKHAYADTIVAYPDSEFYKTFSARSRAGYSRPSAPIPRSSSSPWMSDRRRRSPRR